MNPQGKGLSPERFRLGLNYWPSSSAMAFWRAFDREQLGLDFSTIAAAGFDSVRIFLTWEDFQPTPSHIEASSVSNLIAALDEAALAGLDAVYGTHERRQLDTPVGARQRIEPAVSRRGHRARRAFGSSQLVHERDRARSPNATRR